MWLQQVWTLRIPTGVEGTCPQQVELASQNVAPAGLDTPRTYMCEMYMSKQVEVVDQNVAPPGLDTPLTYRCGR